MYSLFSNVIRSDTNDEICRNIINWNRNEILSFIRKKADEVLVLKDDEFFTITKGTLFLVCENLRSYNLSLALEVYMSFYHGLTTRIYSNIDDSEKANNFLQTLDYTDVYYNIAKLKWDSGDYDTALYFILEADKQYEHYKDKKKGDFLKFLLDSKTLVLWNFIPFMLSDFENYKNQFDVTTLNDFTGFKINNNIIRTMLFDFDLVILLQFINSVNRYHNFLSLKKNDYKSLRQSRILGELSWLFECYLKDNFSVSDANLDNLITGNLFSGSKDLRSIYDELKLIPGLSTENTRSKVYKKEAIQHLLNNLKLENNSKRVAVICLKILSLVRNYTAHYIGDEFIENPNYSIELYLVILGSFTAAFSLINQNKEII